jgi:hypothetical protein
MMTDQHPITPPLELVKQWLGTYFGTTVTGEVSSVELALATQAARWGADQELEACCEWLVNALHDREMGAELRAARRPKPPSLKEQALLQLDTLNADPAMHDTGCYLFQMRRALETIND